MDTNDCKSGDEIGSLATWGLDRSTQKALNAVMLDESATHCHLNSLAMTPHNILYTSPLYRVILFSFANNFAGIGALPTEKVLGYLQRETSEDLYRIIRSTPDYYTTRAIARNLFLASIEAGNDQIVDFLLRVSFPDVQVNFYIPSCMGEYCTPIEKAAALMHTKVVKVLLAHGADVNHSRPEGVRFAATRCSALNCLVLGLRHSEPNIVDQIDPELFSVLVHAGGKMDDDALEILIRNDRKGRFVPLIFSKHISESHKHWSEEGIFLKVFRYYEPQRLSEILELMLTNNVDLNYQVNQVYNRRYDRPRKTLIDEIAFHGDLVLVETLLGCGARLTADTLPCAIQSGNEDLVKRLFNLSATTDSKGWSEQSALATAISVQNRRMIELVVGQQGLGFLEDPEHLQEVVKAASISGDIFWINDLVKNGGVLNSYELGQGLANAVKEGKTDVALALLDAGADIEVDYPYDKLPLVLALQRGNAELVFALLDAGASPDFPFYSLSRESSIELAVKYGDPHVFRALVEAGASLASHRALTVAIENRNKELAIMLLHAGYDISSNSTALSAAMKTGDLDLVHFVLEWGADPHDPDALHLAWNQNAAVFDIILGKHVSRYPKGRKGWGAEILKEAIDRDDFKSFQQILERGADANCCLRKYKMGHHSATLFGYAIAESNNKRIKFVEFLLQQQQISGCTPETVASWLDSSYSNVGAATIRYTAFLTAIRVGDLPMIELFLKHGANMNFPARLGIKRTPLQQAAEIGNTDVAELLLKRGADPNGSAAHKGGGTALQVASINGYLRIVQLLLEHGADVNAPASKVEGRTPLEGAAEHGRLDMVAYLLKAGAGHGGKDKKDFERAIGRAEKNCYPYIADLLKQYLATGKVSASQPRFEDLVNLDMFE